MDERATAAGTAPATSSVDILDRDPALDGVRGFALCMVLLAHGFGVMPGFPGFQVIHTVLDSMQISLDLFFVLSGFLITSILLRTREGPRYFTNFYARRVLRVFPAYYLLLLCVIYIRPLLFGPPAWQGALEQSAPYYLLYVQNMVMALNGEGLGWVGVFHTFSLAIEEQFYLLWPLAIWAVPRHRLMHACVLLTVASMAIKVVLFASGASWWDVYMSTFARFHGLTAGAALAVWISAQPSARPPNWVRLMGIVSGLLLLVEVVLRALEWTSWETYCFLLNLTAVPFFFWALFEVITIDKTARIRRLVQWRPLTFLGRYSYGMYLIHAVVLWELRLAYLRSWGEALGSSTLALIVSGAVGISISLVLAIIMFHAVESPILQLKRFFTPKRADSARSVAVVAP